MNPGLQIPNSRQLERAANFEPSILHQNKMGQIKWDNCACRMKKESIIQDLLHFLQLTQNQLAEFFNISRSLNTKAALGTRKFPIRQNQRRQTVLRLAKRSPDF